MGERRYKSELKSFGIRLKQLRKSRQWVQLDLEVKTGISRADISKIENGQKNIEFYTIVRIAEALGIEIKELFEY